jgi:hypothetical protein
VLCIFGQRERARSLILVLPALCFYAINQFTITHSEIEELKVQTRDNTVAILSTLHTLRASAVANSVIDEFEKTVEVIERGLMHLIHGKLDPGLIPPSTIQAMVLKMKLRAEAAQLITPVTEIASVYGLGCSFVADTPRKLSVVVHLPLTRPNSLMTVYRFLDLGSAVADSNISLSIQTEKSLIAVNKERTGFILLDSLSDCLSLGHLSMCPNHNFQLKAFSHYCISSLFIGNAAAAEDNCNPNVLPAQARVIQHDKFSFYVFHPLTDTLTVDQCHNVTHNRQVTFRGTQLITLEPGCFGHTANYQLSPLVELGIQLTSVTFTSALSLPKLLKGYSIPTLNKIFPKPLAQITKIQDIKKMYEALPVASNPYQWTFPWHWLGAGTSTFFLVILLIVGFCFFRNYFLSKCKDERSTVVNVNTSEQGHATPTLRRSSLSSSLHNIANQALGRLRDSVSNLNQHHLFNRLNILRGPHNDSHNQEQEELRLPMNTFNPRYDFPPPPPAPV